MRIRRPLTNPHLTTIGTSAMSQGRKWRGEESGAMARMRQPRTTASVTVGQSQSNRLDWLHFFKIQTHIIIIQPYPATAALSSILSSVVLHEGGSAQRDGGSKPIKPIQSQSRYFLRPPRPIMMRSPGYNPRAIL
jgi:hypothetical protein